jgi:hypothetical protein
MHDMSAARVITVVMRLSPKGSAAVFPSLATSTRKHPRPRLFAISPPPVRSARSMPADVEALLLSNRVIVFSDRPARIRADLAVDLPYPRHRDHRSCCACGARRSACWDWRATGSDLAAQQLFEAGHRSLHWMRPDFPQPVAKVPCRERVRRWLLAVRTERRRHDYLIDGIQQFTRALEILDFDLVERLGQHLCLVWRRRTLPCVDPIDGRVAASKEALDKEIIFHA